jgi:ubiquinone biosynthesis protein UbiJ
VTTVDVATIIDEVEEALRTQLALVTGDEAAARAGDAIVAALQPALERAAYHLAEQAAEEVDAQLPGRTVSVRLQEGTPILTVEDDEEPITIDTNELEARLTLRLSDKLKAVLEEVATESGDSVNSYVVKTLASKTRHRSTGRRFIGTIET